MAKRGLSRGKAMDDLGLDNELLGGNMPSLSLAKGIGQREDTGFARNNNITITPIKLGERSPARGG